MMSSGTEHRPPDPFGEPFAPRVMSRPFPAHAASIGRPATAWVPQDGLRGGATMGNRTIPDGAGGTVTVDENGNYVNTKDWDTDYYVTTDRNDITAAAKQARSMIQVLERGAKAGGFKEPDCLSLLGSFLILGQWTRGSGYASSVSLHFTFKRTPRSTQGGTKYSGMLLFWLKKFESSFDPKDRRQAFDELQALMFDFVWAFHRELIRQYPERAKVFDKELRALATKDIRTSYRFHW
jgi:hypothetical protein